MVREDDVEVKEWIRIVDVRRGDAGDTVLVVQCLRCDERMTVANEEGREFDAVMADICVLKEVHRKCGADKVLRRFLNDQR